MVLNKCLPKVQSSMIFFLHYAFTSTVIYNPGQLRYLFLYSQSPYTTNLEWFSFYFKLCYTFKKHLKQLCNMSKKLFHFYDERFALHTNIFFLTEKTLTLHIIHSLMHKVLRKLGYKGEPVSSSFHFFTVMSVCSPCHTETEILQRFSLFKR